MFRSRHVFPRLRFPFTSVPVPASPDRRAPSLPRSGQCSTASQKCTLASPFLPTLPDCVAHTSFVCHFYGNIGELPSQPKIFVRFLRPPATNSFRIRTSAKCANNSFRIRTSKTQDLKSFRIRTYLKRWGWGPPGNRSEEAPRSESEFG